MGGANRHRRLTIGQKDVGLNEEVSPVFTRTKLYGLIRVGMFIWNLSHNME